MAQAPITPSRLRTGLALDPPKLQQPRADVLSPVNQHGCFDFDRIIKAGAVSKRTRKTKSWKPIHIVLRPNCLSIYRDKNETQLRHQINLADITTVARQRDAKRKVDHVFAIFSPARNYHLSTHSDADAQDWVDLIRAEARIDQDDGDFELMSPIARNTSTVDRLKQENIGSSSSDTEARPASAVAPENMHSARRSSQALNYSGNERGSLSDFDFSDSGVQASAVSLPRRAARDNRNVSQSNQLALNGGTPDEERVVYHGWLYVLKSKGGVRQWKKVWVVLRPKGLALYKNDEEYSASLIIPFTSIIDAVDIDSVSKSKQHCMQIISEEKNFRFAAPDESALSKWLGAFKSLLVKRRETEQKRNAPPPAPSTGAAPATQHKAPSATDLPLQQPLTIR